jgi:lipopolysaccharide/colanic/teichoic acid biosynthesis glycosyltransferase
MKRAADVLLSTFGILLLSPIMLAIAIIIRWQLGSPVLFVQQRAGLHGEPFRLIKFRTMLDEQDASGRTRSEAERITRVGRALRSTSLDELPELWNVLRGEMSLVGPRPLLLDYLPLYSSRQMRRHEVRPGISGLAQVNGRNALTWEDRFELDVWYVENRSFLLDAKILFLTVLRVLQREGINSAGQTTMARFTGSDRS